jgi:transcriptional regulator with XRE-family HTH domain
MENASDLEDLNQVIAANLKELRKTRGLTLDDLAELSGVSKSMLGQVERGECGLSVATLWKITNGLKISFTSLMRENRPKTRIVENKSVTPLTNGQSGFRLYPVFPFEYGRDFEILYLEIDPGAVSQSEPHEPGSEEFTMVNQGTLSLTVGKEHYDVPAGHSIRYNGDLPHSYANHAEEPVRLCMVIRYAHR